MVHRDSVYGNGNGSTFYGGGKLILAPMVRIGRLPTRILALEYGADIVYTPEIVDKRLIKSIRIVNDKLGTIDFIDETDPTVVNLRIHPAEKSRLVVQIGTASPETALEAARKVESDAVGIDVNCGCPKRFSIISGMGATLLRDKERLVSILKSLVDNTSLLVSCKIRIVPGTDYLQSKQATVDLIKDVQKTGISALAIHCRLPSDHPEDLPDWSIISDIIPIIRIPLIINGGIRDRQHSRELSKLLSFDKEADCSFMIATGAMRNVSVFMKSEPLSPIKSAQMHVKLSLVFDMPLHCTKYAISCMRLNKVDKNLGPLISSAKTYLDLCECLDIGDFYRLWSKLPSSAIQDLNLSVLKYCN